jgi:hypothetical protein
MVSPGVQLVSHRVLLQQQIALIVALCTQAYKHQQVDKHQQQAAL